MTSVCHGYHMHLQTIIDQRNVLYRDYAGIAAQIRARCLAQQDQNDALVNELAAANGHLAVLEAKLYSSGNYPKQTDLTAVNDVVLRCKLDRVRPSCEASLMLGTRSPAKRCSAFGG